MNNCIEFLLDVNNVGTISVEQAIALFETCKYRTDFSKFDIELELRNAEIWVLSKLSHPYVYVAYVHACYVNKEKERPKGLALVYHQIIRKGSHQDRLKMLRSICNKKTSCGILPEEIDAIIYGGLYCPVLDHKTISDLFKQKTCRCDWHRTPNLDMYEQINKVSVKPVKIPDSASNLDMLNYYLLLEVDPSSSVKSARNY